MDRTSRALEKLGMFEGKIKHPYAIEAVGEDGISEEEKIDKKLREYDKMFEDIGKMLAGIYADKTFRSRYELGG